MSNYLKLPSHYVTRGAVRAVTCEHNVNGTTVAVDRPLMDIGDGLFVSPFIEPDGNGLRIRLDVWIVLCLRGERATGFPFSLRSQALAVRAARAFEQDPDITWSAPHEQRLAWGQAFIGALDTEPREAQS
ncbi:MAG: hypothetical protein JWQ81_6518 [Amycolatopsis sp.]|uniref:hypothetical protein n=1 Tax=Amycolatopsis sp. TaxID=37632 RepID=UPI00262F8BEB|nr:hypothetical protein [Amycolatopsis sp.]MCU1685779.1 hypothetical protein [Amycolatopsis sp.]